MNSTAFLACLAPPWVHTLSYWIPVSLLPVALALVVVCFAIELRRRRFRWLFFYAAFLALQPGWELLWQETYGGGVRVRADCGYGNRSSAIFLLWATAAVLVVVVRRPALRRRTFLFGLVAALTALHLLDLVVMFSGLYEVIPAIPSEVYASIFTGFGGGPQITMFIVPVCILFYFLQKLRFRKAV